MLRFAKYHGLGNDFILMDSKDLDDYDYQDLAIRLCNRKTGIGADGLIIANTQHKIEMAIYNADGSQAAMCGNGLRTFAHYLNDNGFDHLSKYDVITLAGLMVVEVTSVVPFKVKVNMGKPIFDESIKSITPRNKIFINEELEYEGRKYPFSSFIMGANHTVVYVDDLDAVDFVGMGKFVQSLKCFPDGTNVNFVQVIDEETIRMQTYERGAGLTLACGTGACASVVLSSILKKTKSEVTVKLPLGELNIEHAHSGDVFMIGPSEFVFSGEVKVD